MLRPDEHKRTYRPVKKATRAGIDRFITKMIKKTTKAPPGLHRIKRVAKDTTRDIKRTGKGWGFSWGLLALIAVPILVIIYFLFTKDKEEFGEGGIIPGEKLDKPIDLRGRDTKGLLDDFGYK